MKIHELKSWPQFFALVVSGEKSFEVRLNDRDFQVGDFLFLREYDPQTRQYSGRFQYVRVTYMLGSRNHCAVPQVLHPDYVILAISLHWSGQVIPPGQKLVSDRPEPKFEDILIRHCYCEESGTCACGKDFTKEPGYLCPILWAQHVNFS